MQQRLTSVVRVSTLFICFWYGGPAAAGVISGVVESDSGAPTSGALVIVTEAGSGLPLNADGTTVPKLGRGSNYPLAVKAGADGKFELEVPEGTYNLFAQSYGGSRVPVGDQPFNGLFPAKCDTVSAEGRVGGISVPSPGAGDVHLKPAGTGTIQIRFDAGGYNDIAVLSTAPPDLDPIFGFAGWIDDFMNHAIAVNLVPLGKTDFHNVPAGPVYIAVFGNDNIPGYGVADVKMKDGLTTTVEMQLVAGWSNGKKTPPAELAGLYQKFVRNDWSGADLPALPRMAEQDLRGDPLRVREVLVEENPVVMLPDGSKASARDIYTVLMYRNLSRQ